MSANRTAWKPAPIARWASHVRGSWSSLIIAPRPTQLGRPAEVVEPVQVVRRVLAGELDVVEPPRMADHLDDRRPRRVEVRADRRSSLGEQLAEPVRAHRSALERQPDGLARRGRPFGGLQHRRRQRALAAADERVAALGDGADQVAQLRGVGLQPDRIVGVERIERRSARRSSPSRRPGSPSRTVPYESSSMIPFEPVIRSCIAEPRLGCGQLVGQPDLDHDPAVERVVAPSSSGRSGGMSV